jgi:hypothetical protein
MSPPQLIVPVRYPIRPGAFGENDGRRILLVLDHVILGFEADAESVLEFDKLLFSCFLLLLRLRQVSKWSNQSQSS